MAKGKSCRKKRSSTKKSTKKPTAPKRTTNRKPRKFNKKSVQDIVEINEFKEEDEDLVSIINKL